MAESEEAQKLKQQIDYLTALIIHADDPRSTSATYNRKTPHSANKRNDYSFVSKSKHNYLAASQPTGFKHTISSSHLAQEYVRGKSKPTVQGQSVVRPDMTNKTTFSATSSGYGFIHRNPQHTLNKSDIKTASTVVRNSGEGLNTYIKQPSNITRKSNEGPSIDKVVISDPSTTTTYKPQQTGYSGTVLMSALMLPKQRVSGNSSEYPTGQQSTGMIGNVIHQSSSSMIKTDNAPSSVNLYTGIVHSHLSPEHQSSNVLSNSVSCRSTSSNNTGYGKNGTSNLHPSPVCVPTKTMKPCSSVYLTETKKDEVNTRQVVLLSERSRQVTKPQPVIAGPSIRSASLPKHLSNLASTTSNTAAMNSQQITHTPGLSSHNPAGTALANAHKIFNQKNKSLQSTDSFVLSPLHSSKLILEQELAATDSRLKELQSEITKLSSKHDKSGGDVSRVTHVSSFKMSHSGKFKCFKQSLLGQGTVPRLPQNTGSQRSVLMPKWQEDRHGPSVQCTESVISDRVLSGTGSPLSVKVTSTSNVPSMKSPYKIVHDIPHSHSAPSSPMASRVDVNFPFNSPLNTTYNLSHIQQGFHSADEDSSNSAYRLQRNRNSSLQCKGKVKSDTVKSVPAKTSKYKIVHNKPYFPPYSNSVVKTSLHKMIPGLSNKHWYVASGLGQRIHVCSNQQNKRTKLLETSRYKLINTDKKSVTKSASATQVKARYVASKYKLKKMTPNYIASSYKLRRINPNSENISKCSKAFIQNRSNVGTCANYKARLSTLHQLSTVTRYTVNRTTPKSSRNTTRTDARRCSQGPSGSSVVNSYKLGMSALASRRNHQPRKLLWRSKISLVYAPLFKAGKFPWRHTHRTAFKYSYVQPYQRCRFLDQHTRPVLPKKCQLKLDRRLTNARYSSSRMVILNGMVYRSSKRKLTRSKNPAKMTTYPIVRSQTSGSRVKYLKSRNLTIINVRGVKFCLDSNGKTLRRVESSEHTQSAQLHTSGQSTRTSLSNAAGTSLSATGSGIRRVDIGGITYVETAPGTLERLTTMQSRQRTSRTINRSIQTTKAKTGRFSANKKYCMFYNRFGRCNRGDKCSFVHDPDKVAVCTRFLRGKCEISNCQFSHKVAKEKMPVCSYFLRGLCIRDNCPYSHVNVGRNAAVCSDFLHGYCALGEKCPKKHILDCPEYSRTGQCPAGDRCKLKHSRRKAMKRRISTTSRRPQGAASTAQTVSADLENTVQPDDSMDKLVHDAQETSDDTSDPTIPWKMRKLPAFISLDMQRGEISEAMAPVAHVMVDHSLGEDKGKLHIKPRLL